MCAIVGTQLAGVNCLLMGKNKATGRDSASTREKVDEDFYV